MKVGFLLLGCALLANGANILGVFPIAGKSMNILYNKLMKGLADNGHDVTVISAHPNRLPLRNGTYRDVILTGFSEEYEKYLDSQPFLETSDHFPLRQHTHDYHTFLPYYNETFHHPNMIDFLNEDLSFDLVVTEYFYADAPLALASKYRCPLVIFTGSGGVNPWVNAMVGNPLPVSYVPHYHMVGDFSQGMSFLQRLHNLIFYLYDFYHHYFVQFPEQDKILHEAGFPQDYKFKAAALHYSASLVLLGTHSSFRQATPTAPNVVEIGGFHIDPPGKLPRDLQEFLDASHEGVIFFSMGSHVRSKNFSPARKLLFLEVFRKLSVKVLWKYEEEHLPGKPGNVLIRKWVPQMDVLAHPNLKLFITHGGHGSIVEGIHRGVPMLTIPVFIDQFNNAFLAANKGFSLRLPYRDKNFTAGRLQEMIEEMLRNPVYAQKAKEVSALYHDRPVKPLEAAVYWMEYVTKYKGADHLKVAGILVPWYQFYMVDVLGVILCVLLGVGWAIKHVVSGCFKRKVKSD